MNFIEIFGLLILGLGFIQLLLIFWNLYLADIKLINKLAIVVISFTMLAGSYWFYFESLGRPLPSFPSSSFQLNGYKLGFHDKKRVIYFWAKTDKIGERLYIVPYRPKLKKKFDQMLRDRKKGFPTRGTFKRKLKGLKHETVLIIFKVRRELPPK